MEVGKGLFEVKFAEEFRTVESRFGEVDRSPGEEVRLRKQVPALVEITPHNLPVEMADRMIEQRRGRNDLYKIPFRCAGSALKGFPPETAPSQHALVDFSRSVSAVCPFLPAMQKKRSDTVALKIIVIVIAVRRYEKLAAGILPDASVIRCVDRSALDVGDMEMEYHAIRSMRDAEADLGIGVGPVPIVAADRRETDAETVKECRNILRKGILRQGDLGNKKRFHLIVRVRG